MKLSVNLPHHSYDLRIERGSLAQVGQWLREIWSPQRVCIITDDTVKKLYEETVRKDLEKSGFEVVTFSVPQGESSKSFQEAMRAYDFLAENGFTRSDGIVALGGGVIGDLAGFIASTYMRGIHFVQIPTTLLAQVDSSIGGKTAVNTQKAKNLVGTFSQPDAVLIDPQVLETLAIRRVREGTAEIVKYALIADKTLWEDLLSYKDEKELFQHAENVLLKSLKIKKKVVEEDELDNGIRLILNFGHTIGHAVEATAGYGVVTHGEGVAIGMVQINQVATQKGYTPSGIQEQLIAMLEKFNLPTSLETWNEEALYQALTHDKKTRGKNVKIVLLEAIGTSYIKSVPIEEMREFLRK